jgi:hypothetical protein
VPVAFFEERGDIPHGTYSDDLMTGDVNGDGKEDILVHGSYVVSSINRRVHYWDLYLGNDTFRAEYPDRIISADKGWAPMNIAYSGMIDINADGCADIMDGTAAEPGDVQLFLSSRDLPETVLTNDTIVNPDYPWVLYPTCICPAGDMNGDGKPDVLVSWGSAFFPLGNLYLLYPGASNGKYKTALGVFGVLKDEHYLELGAYPLGDVNGDGCDDVAVLGTPGNQSSPKSYRFRIYLGSSRMRTSVPEMDPIVPFDVSVHPNPVRSDSGELDIVVTSQQSGQMHLDLLDLLGRSVSQRPITDPDRQQSVTLSIHGLSPGMYSLVVRQGEQRLTRPIIVY